MTLITVGIAIVVYAIITAFVRYLGYREGLSVGYIAGLADSDKFFSKDVEKKRTS